MDPGEVSGHSLRATTRHKSMTVLRWYIREGTLFSENAAAPVGL